MIPFWLFVIIAVLAGCIGFLVVERFRAEQKLKYLLGFARHLEKLINASNRSVAHQLSLHSKVLEKAELAKTWTLGKHTLLVDPEMPEGFRHMISELGRDGRKGGGSELLSQLMTRALEEYPTNREKESSSQSGEKTER